VHKAVELAFEGEYINKFVEPARGHMGNSFSDNAKRDNEFGLPVTFCVICDGLLF
jgi:hypothetical protein